MDKFTVEENYGAHGYGKTLFKCGDEVEILDLQTLEEFRKYWKYVARPTEEQLKYAGVKTKVEKPGRVRIEMKR